MISGHQQALKKLCNALSTGATHFQWLILDFNTTLGDGAAMIARAVLCNPNLRCISFNGPHTLHAWMYSRIVTFSFSTGCALSPRSVCEVLEAFVENPESSPEFLDMSCNFMDEKAVKLVVELLIAPTSRVGHICLDSLDKDI